MNRKKNYKNLDKYRKTCNNQMKRYYDKTVNARNSRQKWTEEEKQLVVEHSITDKELSEKIGRSMKAINVMRVKLKKKMEQEVTINR